MKQARSGLSRRGWWRRALVALVLAVGMGHAATIEELREQVELKRAEWIKAKNALTLLQNFNGNYTGRSQRLASDRQQIQTIRDRVATIQQNNLIKITLQLGAETAQTMKDACEVGTGAAAGVRALAEELLSNTLKDETKKAMGLDTETLTSPRTVRITGLNRVAEQGLPEIEAVQKLLAADLHTVRGQEHQDRAADPNYDMTQPGADPRYWSDNTAILVKLEKVKAALDTAKNALQEISDELDSTHDATVGQMSEAEAEELQKRNDLAFAEFALNDAINAEISAARDAAVEAQINALPAPVPEQPPYVAPKTPEETEQEYEQRRIQTIVDTANANVAPLRAAIDEKIQDFNDLAATHAAKLDWNTPGAQSDMQHLGMLRIFVDAAGMEVELAEHPTPAAVALAHKDVKWYVQQANLRMGALTDAADRLDAMQTVWQEANELRVQVKEWVQMAAAQGVSVSYFGYDTPVEGTGVEGYIAEYEEFSSGVSDKMTTGANSLSHLASRFNELNAALLAEVSAAGSRMQQAEVALAQMAAEAAAADQYLESSGWSWSYDVMPGETTGMGGYSFWGSSGNVYRILTRRTFRLRTMMGELMQALAQPGEQGVIAYQQVLNKYASFLNGFNSVNDRYHAKYVALRQDVTDVVGGYVSTPPAVSVIMAAKDVNPDLPVPGSIPFAGGDLASETSSIDLGDRMAELNSSIATHWGIGTLQWLEEPSLDLPGFPYDTHSPAPVLLAIKQRALREIPTWSNLYFTPWKAKRDAWVAEMDNWHWLYFIMNPFNRLYGMDADWRAQFLQPAEDQVRADAQLLFDRYPHIVDPPTIANMLPDTVQQKLFPDSAPEELRIVSFSERLSFQWYRRLNGSAWTKVLGATQWNYQPAYAEGLQEFYCRLSNASGSCVSDTRSILGIRRPRFVKEPTPALLSARTGATVVLTCALGSTPADGNQVPQWFKAVLDANGRPIIIHSPWGDELYQSEPLVSNPRMSGVHSTTLTITDFQPEDAGAYFVHVFNEYSSSQSAIARVKHVNTDVAPVFLRQPVSRQAMPGDMVTFDVQVNGSPAPQYLWKRNGIALVNGPGVSGADAATLMLSDVQLASGGSYTCLVTCGTKKGTSLPGVLMVKAPAAPVIATAPKPVTADPGANVQFSVTVKGGFPTAYTYQWQKEDGGIWADMSGYTTSSFSIIGITEDDGGKYRCVVGNGAGGANLRSVTSPEAALTLNGLPVITGDPDDATAQYGSTVSFSGAATGIPAPTLQWYRVVDGGEPVALIGQTRSTLNLTLTGEPWASGSAFQVFLRAKNRFGATDSAMANLTLEDPFDSPASVGRYLGLVAPSATLNNDLGGRIDLRLTRVGSYTGTLNMAGRLYPFKGTCDEQGLSDVTVLRKGLPSLVARLTFDGSGALTGQLWQTGDRIPQDLISAHQVPWVTTTNPATAYVGTYTAALQPPTPLPADAPEGTGWVKFKISKAGACSGSGKLSDGTAVTLASVVWPDGSLPLFVSLYTKAGSVLGTVDCAVAPLGGSLRWRKKPATPPAGRNYANGIGPLDLAITGGRYTAPGRGQYLLGLTSTQAGDLTLAVTGGGLPLAQGFDFTLSTAHIATFALSTKPSAPKLIITATTGTVTGSFVVTDTQTVDGKTVTLRRTATVSGILLSPAGATPARILGHFLLPGLLPSTTTSPILSGAMQVDIP